MHRLSVPGPSSQAPERAIREDGNATRDAGRHGQSKAARGPRVVMIVDDHARFRCAMRHWIAELHADDADVADACLKLFREKGYAVPDQPAGSGRWG